MDNQKVSFLTKIWFTEQDVYIKNREEFDNLRIERHKEDQSQFIQIGDILTLDEKVYKVQNISFKLEPIDYMPYNSQILVSLKEQ